MNKNKIYYGILLIMSVHANYITIGNILPIVIDIYYSFILADVENYHFKIIL